MHEVDDVPTVLAGVRVVGFHDVAEQERGAAVRDRELELVVDTRAPLAREHAEQRHERKRERGAERVVRGGERDREPDRGKSRVGELAADHVPDENERGLSPFTNRSQAAQLANSKTYWASSAAR